MSAPLPQVGGEEVDHENYVPHDVKNDQILTFIESGKLQEHVQYFASSEERLEFERLQQEYENGLNKEKFQNETLQRLITQLNVVEAATEEDEAAAKEKDDGKAPSSTESNAAQKGEEDTASGRGLFSWWIPSLVTGVTKEMRDKRKTRELDESVQKQSAADILKAFPNKEAAIAALKQDISERYTMRLQSRQKKEAAMGPLKEIITNLQLRHVFASNGMGLEEAAAAAPPSSATVPPSGENVVSSSSSPQTATPDAPSTHVEALTATAAPQHDDISSDEDWGDDWGAMDAPPQGAQVAAKPAAPTSIPQVTSAPVATMPTKKDDDVKPTAVQPPTKRPPPKATTTAPLAAPGKKKKLAKKSD